MAKKFGNIIRQLRSALNIYVDRREGVVYADWQPVAKLEIIDSERHKISWNPTVAEQLHTNTAEAKEALDKAAKAPRATNVAWQLG